MVKNPTSQNGPRNLTISYFRSYPLEIWHVVGSGDAEFVPYLALSCPSSREYGCTLRLDLSQNNRRITIPLQSTENKVANVNFIVQLVDRENGQQMLVTIKEATSDDTPVCDESGLPPLLVAGVAEE